MATTAAATTTDHSALFTFPHYEDEIPFHDLDLSDVFAPGLLESQQQAWGVMDWAGKTSDVFPLPTSDFGFNYPVELPELGLGLGFEGDCEGIRSPPEDTSSNNTTLSTLLRSTSDQATQRALYMTTSASADPASPHHNNNSHHHIYSSPCSSPATNSDDADSIYFPRTPPPPPHRISDSNRKRKATETETDPLPYSSWVQSPSSSTSPLNNLALGVSSEQRQKIHHNHYQYDQQQLAFYPSPTTTTTSRNHPKRRCSSVIPDREAYQDQQQDQGLARDQEDIFTPLEMPDGSTRFTSNWLPVDPSGGFTICPDPLAGMTSEAFVSVGS